MQTISLPYSCSDDDRRFITDCRRAFSTAVRTAYVAAMDQEGWMVREKDVRHLVKSRLAGGIVDAWVLHCATQEGRELRKARPDGRMVFGGRKNLERRRKGLIGRDEWREMRLRPLCSRGDKTIAGNRHFRLAPDALTCGFRMYGRSCALRLPAMKGNAGEILRQAAVLAGEKKINLTFRIDATHLHVTVNPDDLPDHPERRRPVTGLPGRALGIDLNPGWIGLAAVANTKDPTRLDGTELLDHALVKLGFERDVSRELVRETLAAVADRAIGMARAHRCGRIVLEKGLGKLRSGGKNRGLNHLINYWARTVFVALLTRKAKLAGIEVVLVWGGYSTTIGNLAFEAPDACASAAEIARRGIALASGKKDVLPVCTPEVVAGLWKDRKTPVGDLLRHADGWGGVHRAIKTAKLGVRRPHPALPDPGVHPPLSDGHAVRRLRHRRRPGTIFRPVAIHAGGGARNRFVDKVSPCDCRAPHDIPVSRTCTTTS